jgi:hypothetical protein
VERVGEVLVTEVRSLVLVRLRRIPWGVAKEAVKFSDVEREVDVAEGGTGDVDVGQVGGGREGVGAGSGTGSKGAVEIGEAFVEDEAGKEGAEEAALGEPFLLEKGGPGGGFGMQPAGVGGVVEHIKEGDDAA